MASGSTTSGSRRRQTPADDRRHPSGHPQVAQGSNPIDPVEVKLMQDHVSLGATQRSPRDRVSAWSVARRHHRERVADVVLAGRQPVAAVLGSPSAPKESSRHRSHPNTSCIGQPEARRPPCRRTQPSWRVKHQPNMNVNLNRRLVWVHESDQPAPPRDARPTRPGSRAPIEVGGSICETTPRPSADTTRGEPGIPARSKCLPRIRSWTSDTARIPTGKGTSSHLAPVSRHKINFLAESPLRV